MQFRKTLVIFLALVFVIGVALTGCATQEATTEPEPSGTAASNEPTTTPSEKSTFDEIMSRGIMRVGLIDQPPTNSKDPVTGEWTGFAVDVMSLVAEPMGVELEIVECGWDNIIAQLQAGKIDIAFAGMWATPARAMSVWFTRPYRHSGVGLVIRQEDSDRFKTIEDLNKEGVVISVAVGTSTVDTLKERFPKATIKEVKGATRYQEVAAGRADAGAADYDTSYRYVTAHSDWAMIFPDQPFAAVPVAGCVRRGDEHWLRYVNSTLEFHQTKGTIDQLIKKWYLDVEITE